MVLNRKGESRRPWVCCLFNLHSGSRLSLGSIHLHQSMLISSGFYTAPSKTPLESCSYSSIYKKVAQFFTITLNLDLQAIWKLQRSNMF